MVDMPRYMCVYISMKRERGTNNFCLVRYNKNIFLCTFGMDIKTHKGNIRYIGLTALNQLHPNS